MYYVPASRVSLLSLSSLLKHGWTVDMRDGGGTIKRGKERLTLRKDGPLWTTVIGTVEPLILAAGIGSEGKSVLEEEHQRLGHIGREKLLDLAKAGKLKGSYEDLRKDPFRTDQCEVCLRAKIERYPKTWGSAHPARRRGRDSTRCRPSRTTGSIGRRTPLPICGYRAIKWDCICHADRDQGRRDEGSEGSSGQAGETAW